MDRSLHAQIFCEWSELPSRSFMCPAWAKELWFYKTSLKKKRIFVYSLLNSATWDPSVYRAHLCLVIRTDIHTVALFALDSVCIRSLPTTISKKKKKKKGPSGLSQSMTVASSPAENCCWIQWQSLPRLKYLLSLPCLFRVHSISLVRYGFFLSTPSKTLSP